MTEEKRTMFVVMKSGVPIFVSHFLDLALKAQVENETTGSPCTIVPVTPTIPAPKKEPVQMELDLDFDDEPTDPDFYLLGPKL